jgi:hypothetical protein
MSFHDTMNTLDDVRHSTPMSSEFYVEAVAFQLAAIWSAAPSVAGHVPIKDTRARLRVAARYIKNGTVKFPRSGCE